MLNLKEDIKVIEILEKALENSVDFFSYTSDFKCINVHELINNSHYSNKSQILIGNNKTDLTILGFGSVHEIECSNSFDINNVKSKIHKVLNNIISINDNEYANPKFLGGYAFNIDSNFDGEWRRFPKGKFILPECMITLSKNQTWITIIKKIDSDKSSNTLYNEILKIYDSIYQNNMLKPLTPINILNINDNIEKNDYLNIVDEIIDKVKSNNISKIVFARSKHISFDRPLDLRNIMKMIQDIYPDCINFFVKFPKSGIFFGSTPERLILKNGNYIKTQAIAGTMKRGINLDEDISIATKLKTDKKNIKEHKYVIDEITKILNAKLNTLKVSKKPKILKLKQLQHLVSNISGYLKTDTHILELVNILHPTPAIAGTPTDKALKLINHYEKNNRGWYSGPLGWIDKNGDGDFCVALRSGYINNNDLQLFSGGGIVADSNSEDEWEETELKFRTILDLFNEDPIHA
tara:strand:+ start:41 stop:1435 length:1395 start_codon:yes stop_codon:yes gene_type:complete